MFKKKKETKEQSNREELVNLLIERIPNLFDRFPQAALSRDAVGKLVDELRDAF